MRSDILRTEAALSLAWENHSFPLTLGQYIYIYISYRPSIFPATLSTASFNLNDSLTTVSFSSSPQSAMNVAVSGTKPASNT